MIRAFLTLFVLFAPSVGFAADDPPSPPPPATKIENLLVKRGVVLEKVFNPAGRLDCRYNTDIEMDDLTVKTTAGGPPSRGLKVSVENKDRYGNTETAFLDTDEVDGLVGALDFIGKKAAELSGKELPYTEVLFKTRDDFVVGFYLQDKTINYFVTAGRIRTETCYMRDAALFDVVKAAAKKVQGVSTP
jgi:hypothetical protein